MSRPAAALAVGERFELIEVGALADGRTPDAGTWEVIRVSPGSATCRKAGTRFKAWEVKNEWVTHPVTGAKYKRPLAEPKLIEGEFPESRTITISPRAMVRRVASSEEV